MTRGHKTEKHGQHMIDLPDLRLVLWRQNKGFQSIACIAQIIFRHPDGHGLIGWIVEHLIVSWRDDILHMRGHRSMAPIQDRGKLARPTLGVHRV
jgi:hypothetical protein